MITVADVLNNTSFVDNEVIQPHEDYDFNIQFPVVINWDEEQHPRDERGRFGAGSGTTTELKQIRSGAEGRSGVKGGSSSEDHTEGEQSRDVGAHRQQTESHERLTPTAILGQLKQVGSKIGGLKAALGQKVWDAMTPGQQAGYASLKAGIDKVEHKLEGAYKAGQNAAKEVMKEQGMSADHIETAGKLLGAVDGIAKWTSNIPVAHEAITALTHIGGPIAFLGAKVGYYTPVASLAYVGASLAKAVGQDVKKAVLGSKDPYQTIKIARAAIRGVMAKQEHGESHTMEGALAHGVAGAMHLATHTRSDLSINVSSMKENAPKIVKFLTDHDFEEDCVALLYAALDETMTAKGPDVDKAIKMANLAYDERNDE